jgi:hypothetical protein
MDPPKRHKEMERKGNKKRDENGRKREGLKVKGGKRREATKGNKK